MLRVFTAALPSISGYWENLPLGPADTSRPFPTVKEKLRLDPDSEIATTGVRVSLICPVSRGARVCGCGWVDSACCAAAHTHHLPPPQLVKMRLSVPCRAETCAHLQCFDAVFYLQMNEKKPTWMCPVCDKPAPYDQLIIDG